MISMLWRQKLEVYRCYKPAASRNINIGILCFCFLKLYWSVWLAVLKIASLLAVSQSENYLTTRLLLLHPGKRSWETLVSFPLVPEEEGCCQVRSLQRSQCVPGQSLESGEESACDLLGCDSQNSMEIESGKPRWSGS